MVHNWGGSDRVGWICSSKSEAIHVVVFDIEVRLSPTLFMQTVKWRADAGECLVCFLFPCLLILGGKSSNISVNALLYLWHLLSLRLFYLRNVIIISSHLVQVQSGLDSSQDSL